MKSSTFTLFIYCFVGLLPIPNIAQDTNFSDNELSIIREAIKQQSYTFSRVLTNISQSKESDYKKLFYNFNNSKVVKNLVPKRKSEKLKFEDADVYWSFLKEGYFENVSVNFSNHLKISEIEKYQGSILPNEFDLVKGGSKKQFYILKSELMQEIKGKLLVPDEDITHTERYPPDPLLIYWVFKKEKKAKKISIR